MLDGKNLAVEAVLYYDKVVGDKPVLRLRLQRQTGRDIPIKMSADEYELLKDMYALAPKMFGRMINNLVDTAEAVGRKREVNVARRQKLHNRRVARALRAEPEHMG